jgi:mediator of RNA polymerase II transcription subunit 8, fungi type
MSRSSLLTALSTFSQNLQNSARILKQNMTHLLEIVQQHSSTFQRVVVYPSTNYPGRTQEGIIMQLLRKKLEPDVETLVEAAREAALAAGIDPKASFNSTEDAQQRKERKKRAKMEAEMQGYASNGDDDDEDEDNSDDSEEGDPEPHGIGDVWFDSRAWCKTRLAEFVRDDYQDAYTAEERAMGIENVRTGLRQNLEDEYEDDDEDEEEDDTDGDQAMTDVSSAPAGDDPSAQPGAGAGQQANSSGLTLGEDPERMLWFAARGDRELPPGIELESQRAEKPGQKRRFGDR